jgi:hypothetical protein
MSEVVSIRLTPENASILDVLQKRQPIVLDDLINRALSDYFFAIRFDEVRARLSTPVAGQPQYTEDEIFDLVS